MRESSAAVCSSRQSWAPDTVVSKLDTPVARPRLRAVAREQGRVRTALASGKWHFK